MNLTTIGALICIAACGAGATDARALSTTQSSTRQTLRFAGAETHTLQIRAITGAITVEAYDGREVEMLVDKTISADTENDLRAAERDVVLDTSDNAAVIRAIVREPDQGVCGDDQSWSRHRSRPRYIVRYDFTIRVPRNTRLDLCTINKGDITVTGTHKDFTIRSVNGRITMTDMTGAGEAITINGRITASFVSAPPASSLFKTINGDVIVTLPQRLAAELRMKTFNGGLYTDFEVQPLPAQTLVAVERRNGMSVYSNEFTTVRVGNGGPQLTLDTLNGDVRVLRGAK
jgi:hypothetical protein